MLIKASRAFIPAARISSTKGRQTGSSSPSAALMRSGALSMFRCSACVMRRIIISGRRV